MDLTTKIYTILDRLLADQLGMVVVKSEYCEGRTDAETNNTNRKGIERNYQTVS